jgi:MraZ protein
MRFIGNIEAKADSKGRVFVPAIFRRTLQAGGVERLMMRKDIFQSCLVLYPEESWNEQLNTLRSRLDRWNSRHQMIFRQFVADVEELGIDSNGRILLPKRYMAMAGIVQEVRFIGMDDTIEIWAKEKLDKPFMNPADFGRELEKIMTAEKGGDNE